MIVQTSSAFIERLNEKVDPFVRDQLRYHEKRLVLGPCLRINGETLGIHGRIDNAAFPSIAFPDLSLDISGIRDKVRHALSCLVVPIAEALPACFQSLPHDWPRSVTVRLIASPDVTHGCVAIADVHRIAATYALSPSPRRN